MVLYTEMGLGDLVKAYAMHQQMMLYPHLVEKMRQLFLGALAERNLTSPEAIQDECFELLKRDDLPDTEDNILKYTNALVDLYFAHHFSQEEIDNYIHLARKLEAFEKLNMAVNSEGATFSKIRQVLKAFCQIPQGSLYLPPSESEGVRVALIDHFVSNQLPFIGIAKNHITIRDIDELLDHAFWNRRRGGKIGGKAAGMYLAYKILLPRLNERDPELEQFVNVPESYYFNSGILSDFIDYNRFYYFHSQKYKSRDKIEEEYGKMATVLENAAFPHDVVSDFRKFLTNVYDTPLILRSSSLLEDNFGYAFSGKYDSVFISNQGDLDTRLSEFMWGLKRVLMSTFSPAAIMYRRDHNLLDFDERMSVLVQKVVGRRFGPYYFPFVGGVAFSQNAYLWSPRIVKEEGLVRLVLGLGTRAVDRVGVDYPRMIPLSHPSLRPEVTVDRIRKYSQKMVDVLNLSSRSVETISYYDLFRVIDYPDLFHALSVEEGGHLAAPPFRGKEINLNRSCITFDNLLTKTRFVPLMKKVLKKLEAAYGHPVDVEFAWDNDKLYVLQCRSLAVGGLEERVVIPKDIAKEDILFTNDRGVYDSITRDIRYIVYVDPRAYAKIETIEDRLAIGRLVGKLNRTLEDKRYALLGPTRWGSNDIKYGVKVGYEDINRALILGEIAFEEAGATPEVSYGTHFFNDLVEAKIVPLAIYPDACDCIFDEAFFMQARNQLSTVAPEFAARSSVVRVIDVPASTGGRVLHVYQDGQGQQGMGFFEAPESNHRESKPQ